MEKETQEQRLLNMLHSSSDPAEAIQIAVAIIAAAAAAGNHEAENAAPSASLNPA